MADYEKMYALLCGAIDDILDDLNRIPPAAASAAKLQKALDDAEEMYVTAAAESKAPPHRASAPFTTGAV